VIKVLQRGQPAEPGLQAHCSECWLDGAKGGTDHTDHVQGAEGGTVQMILDDGTVLLNISLRLWRYLAFASARKAPIEDWVNLAIDGRQRPKAAAPFVDASRAHDAELIAYVKTNSGMS
jgi:monomeric isocitrate dehydrogenase